MPCLENSDHYGYHYDYNNCQPWPKRQDDRRPNGEQSPTKRRKDYEASTYNTTKNTSTSRTLLPSNDTVTYRQTVRGIESDDISLTSTPPCNYYNNNEETGGISHDYDTRKTNFDDSPKRRRSRNLDSYSQLSSWNDCPIHSEEFPNLNSMEPSTPSSGNVNLVFNLTNPTLDSITSFEFGNGLRNLCLNSTIPEVGEDDNVDNVMFEDCFSSSSSNSTSNSNITLTEEDNELLTSRIDSDGNTALHQRIIEKDEIGALRIIRKATCFEHVNVSNKLSQTPLHLAVISGQAQMVRKLMAAGAFMFSTDDDGNTPLHLASQIGRLDIVKHLVSPIMYEEVTENRYKLLVQALPQDMSVENNDGYTCLKLASENGHSDVLEILTDYYWD